MDPAFWKDRRVFVTGHSGFKGSWLSLWLQTLGAHVTGFALPMDQQPNLFEQAAVGEGMTSYWGDIRSPEGLLTALDKTEPEVVFHLAAQPLVRASYRIPLETFATNVMGTAHLLDAVRQVRSVKSVVVITTDKCYENHGWQWGYRESDALGGHDPYSASKACAEIVTASYRRAFNRYDAPGIATARAGNVFGGGDWAEDRIVPDAMRALTRGQPIVVRNPRAVRPWQHVLEPLAGYLLLAEKLALEPERWSEAWNFGPRDEDAVPVGELTEKLANLWGGAWRLADVVPAVHEAAYLKLDCSKARQTLGWRPCWNLDAGLQQTVAWHQFAARDDATPATVRQFSGTQIEAYQHDLLRVGTHEHVNVLPKLWRPAA